MSQLTIATAVAIVVPMAAMVAAAFTTTAIVSRGLVSSSFVCSFRFAPCVRSFVFVFAFFVFGRFGGFWLSLRSSVDYTGVTGLMRFGGVCGISNLPQVSTVLGSL